MRNLKQWLNAYGASHKNKTNVLIHKICVPLIMLSILGIFWAIPTPDLFGKIPFLNWATIFAASCMIFYTLLGIKPALVMLFQLLLLFSVIRWIELSVGRLLIISVSIFVVSWIFQFIGHNIEGKKPSFFEDLQFLLVGPLWVSKGIFFKSL